MKKFIALVSALALTLVLPVSAVDGKVYTDVADSDYFASAAYEMSEKGIMSGVTATEFAPYAANTRATVVTTLWRIAGQPAATSASPFPDAAGTWYETAAVWGKNTGVATGYSGGRFGGDDLLTREQLACFLYRYAWAYGQTLAEGTLGLFNDSDQISSWATDAMKHVIGSGIMQGNGLGGVDPKGITNRAGLAVMLQRMLTPAAG